MVKNTPANTGHLRDTDLILKLGRSSGGGHGNPLQYSCLENLMERGGWRAVDHGIAKGKTQLNRLSMHACQESGLTINSPQIPRF